MSAIPTSTPTVPLLILAGGRATRLGVLSQDLPKYLMPVGSQQIFADQHLTWVRDQGFKEVFLSIGYLGPMIRDYCGSGERWNLQIKYIEDGPHPLGTGGAVRASLTHSYENLCITYGDTLLSFDVANFIANFLKSSYQASVCIYENKVPGHICNVNWRPPLLTYDKAHPNSSWKYIDYGFLIMRRTFIESFPTKAPLDLALPLSESSYQDQISAFLATERFWEIGDPEALEEFKKRT